MKQGLFLIAGLLICSFISPIYAAQNTTFQPLPQAQVPVRISANSFSDLFGEDIKNIQFVKANRNESGALQLYNVPFQWSQMTDEWTVYTPAYKKIPMSGHLERLDEYDRVSFMYEHLGHESCRDAAVQYYNGQHRQHKLVEIQVDPRHGDMSSELRRYVCALVSSGLPLEAASYDEAGHFSEHEKRAYSDYYSLKLDDENSLIWTDFYFKGVNFKNGKPDGKSLLDSLKIMIDAGLFSESARIQLDNSNLETQIVDVQHGPVFDSMFAKTKVKIAGAKVLDMQIMVHFYQSHVEMMTRFKIPPIAKIIVKTPRVNVSLDGYNLWGSKIQTSWGPDEPLVVNGSMDEHEKAFADKEVSGQDAWIWFSTQKGFDLLTFVDFDEDFNVPIALVYDDDGEKKVEPERYPGQGPNVGYSIRGMVIGQYFTFNTNLYFSGTLDQANLQERVIALRQPWDIISHQTLVLNSQDSILDAKKNQM